MFSKMLVVIILIKFVIPKEYTYLYDYVDKVIKGEVITDTELNLVGGRKSCKSTSLFLLYYLLANLPFKVGLIAFRNEQGDAGELFSDMLESFDTYDLPYKSQVSKKTIQIGINKIRIIGLNSMKKGKAKKSGLSRIGNCKYIFRFLEERFEFSEKDVLSIKEAVRGMTLVEEDKDGNLIEREDDYQLIDFNSCNPWAKSSPYISYCSKYQLWDINILRKTGSQFGKYKIPLGKDGDKGFKTAIFHYTNWRAGVGFVPQADINNILDTWNFDRKRAQTVDYGLPGYEEGAIYTHLLDKIGPTIQREQDFLIAGVDYGWGRDPASGKTVAIFGGATIENGVDVYGEYTQDNHRQVKSPDMVAREIVEFYFHQMRIYCNSVSSYRFFNLRVRVDNMAIGFIQILNSTAKNCGHTWLTFGRCKKYPIQDRIEITLALMSKFMLRLNNNVNLLKAEMELSFYVEGEVQKRAKVNDHSLNAFEYALEPLMYKFSRTMNLNHISSKDTKW